MKTIDRFEGPYSFLSNFYISQVMLDGLQFKTVEAAYQAAKTLDAEDRKKISDVYGGGEAKKLGRKVKLRDDWDNIKLDVMLDLLRQKFSTPVLRQSLINTGDAELIEGNYWHDTFWGVCDGEGQNNLGKLLMKVREEIKKVG